MRITLAALAAFAVGFLAVHLLGAGPRPPRIVQNEALIRAIGRSDTGTVGTEILVVYLGSTRCRWCRDPALPGAFAVILDSVRARAARAGAAVSVVGIDVHGVSGHELDHLRAVGSFDQMALGGGVLNLAAAPLVWTAQSSAVGMATPQVFVLERRIRKANPRGTPMILRFAAERLVTRVVGLAAILEWARGGVPLLEEDQ